MPPLTLSEFQDLLTEAATNGDGLDLDSLRLISSQTATNIHLAVMQGPYLDYVISGQKTIESRITKNRIPPYQAIGTGDFVVFKQSSGPVRAVAAVRDALSTETHNLGDLQTLTDPFAPGLAYDSGFLESKDGARFCTLIFLSAVSGELDIPFRKRDRQSWVTIRASVRQSPQAELFETEGRPLVPSPPSDGLVQPQPWVLVCGSIASGKSSVAKEVSRVSRLPCLSFGDLIRQMAADQGSSDDREALQQLGHDLFERLGPEGMVDRLLSEVEGPAVIEGIRHLRVLDALQQRCEPCLVVFIEADRPTIERRFVDRAHHSDVTIDSGRALAHPVESEVEDLRARAGFILDTTETTIEEAARSVLSRVALSASMKSEAASGPATAPEVDRVVEMATKKIEDGIRAYLESLGKPAKPIVDKEAVKALKSEIRGTSDPIEKLRLLTALEDAEAGVIPDTSGDQAVFVAEAKAWAEAEGVSATAFQGLGVPDEILAEAGFEISPAARSTSNRSSGSGRAPRIPIEDVKAAVRKLGSGWKLSDLAAALDRDSATVRNYVNKLVKEGDITIVGDDPKHDGRGRAPKLYAAK